MESRSAANIRACDCDGQGIAVCTCEKASAATRPLRERLGLAIFKAFEADYQQHGTSFDPDTCYRAADEVIALLVGELVNDSVTAKFHPTIIGPAEFVFAGEER